MTKPRSRGATSAGVRTSGRVVNFRDRREKDATASLRRPVGRKISEAQRSALIVWDEV